MHAPRPGRVRLTRAAVISALILAVLPPAPLRSAEPSSTATAADDWAQAEAIVKAIQPPRIPDRDYLITDFGAKPGGTEDARPAILAAIQKASAEGGGRVVIPQGAWLSNGPLRLASHINLHISEGATLLFSPRPADYLPVVLTRWDGTELYGHSPLIYAFEVHDVAITGKGVFDGNGASAFHGWAGKTQERDQLALRRLGQDGTPVARRIFGEGTFLRPSMIQFFRAERVLLRDYTMHHTPFWGNHLVYTSHAVVRGLTVDSHHGNNDGVDVDSSSHVLVEHCNFHTGDDAIALKAGRDRDGREIGRPAEYVVIRHNTIAGEDGVAIGSEMSGGIRHVYFTDNRMRTGKAAFHFKSNLDRGGTVEHIRVRNTTVESFERLFWFHLNYPGLIAGGHPHAFRDIVLENFTVGSVGIIVDADAPAEAPLKNVTLRNIAIREADRLFSLNHVEDLRLENVTVGGKPVSLPPANHSPAPAP